MLIFLLIWLSRSNYQGHRKKDSYKSKILSGQGCLTDNQRIINLNKSFLDRIYMHLSRLCPVNVQIMSSKCPVIPRFIYLDICPD